MKLNMLIKKGVLFLSCMIQLLIWNALAALSPSPVHIGVVLDSNSTADTMVGACMSMAFSDFYSVHSDYQTRLFFHVKLAHDQVDVASQVLGLLEKEQVHGIVGSEKLTEGNLIAELGRRSQVPVISLTERSQSVSNPQNPYFVRTTPDNSNQLKALAAICQGFEWHEAVVVYEDTDDGREFFSELNKEFQKSDIQISSVASISSLGDDYDIKKQLEMLMSMQTRVFIVQMNLALGGRFFLLAKSVGMMSEGYAWIVTDSIGNSLNSMDSTTIEAMEGVLGVRAYVPYSKNLSSFKERWKTEMTSVKHIDMELNVYGLFAYDTVYALAMAAEMIGPVKSSFTKTENGDNGSFVSNLGVSNFGPKLLHQLSNVSFEGLSGEFRLNDGKLEASAVEIFNVIGSGGRTLGYWTPDRGIVGKITSNGGEKYSTSIKGLKTIVWPGDSVTKPKGWSIPETGKLKVGIPKKPGFTEFVQVSLDPLTNKTNATGFSIDIFLAAVQLLPFTIDYDFMPYIDESGFSRGTYTDLIHNISTQYDIVVGDTTILADRATYVDFTLPYSESGIVMVVRDKQGNDMWIFFKPFKWNLWVTILAACIFMGIVLHILEHPAKSSTIEDAVWPQKEHRGLTFWFPIAVLAFPERNIVSTNWARFVLVVWLYMSYIVMQSYTAKLSSMFTVDQLNFRLSDDIIVGYQEGSFVRDFLVTRLHFSEKKLKEFTSVEDIHDKMSRGGKNGGFDVLYDEIPYMKLLLNRYGSEYKMVGPTYKTDGFGFACPMGSALVPYFSRAILSVTEGPNMSAIEQKNFGPQYSSNNQLDNINNDNAGLNVFDFGGLFIIFGSAMLLAVFFSHTKKLAALARHCSEKCCSSLGGKVHRTNSSVHPAANDDSSSDHEVEMSQQMNVNHSTVDHPSARIISTRSTSEHIDVVDLHQSEGIEEIQQSEANHAGR